MESFVNTDYVFDLLTNTVGRMIKEVTGRKVVLDDDETIPKVDDEFIMVSQTDATQLDWADNEWEDEEGISAVSHNYEVTYTFTAYRGKAFSDLNKVVQAFNLPFLYEKYFPTPSAFAYASSSSVSKLRIPVNMQKYENRAVVIVTFNVKFIAVDKTAFESIDKINLEIVYSYPQADNTRLLISSGSSLIVTQEGEPLTVALNGADQ